MSHVREYVRQWARGIGPVVIGLAAIHGLARAYGRLLDGSWYLVPAHAIPLHLLAAFTLIILFFVPYVLGQR